MKKSQYILVVSFMGLITTSIITACFNVSIYVADVCILFICFLAFQLGISTETLNGKQSSSQQAETIKNQSKQLIKQFPAEKSLQNVFGWVFALLITFCIGVVYKVAVWDLLKDGWMKYGAIISFVIGSWLVPFMTGYISRKHFPKLKNTLALK